MTGRLRVFAARPDVRTVTLALGIGAVAALTIAYGVAVVVTVLVVWVTYLHLHAAQQAETTEQTAEDVDRARADAATARADVRAVIDHLAGTEPATGRHAHSPDDQPSPRPWSTPA